MFIGINIDHEENETIIKEWKTVDISMIKNVFFKREASVSKSHIDISDNP